MQPEAVAQLEEERVAVDAATVWGIWTGGPGAPHC